MALSKCPLEGWIFGAQTTKNETPPVTPKLKVREVGHSGFGNISSHPTSLPILATTFGPWNTFSDNDT